MVFDFDAGVFVDLLEGHEPIYSGIRGSSFSESGEEVAFVFEYILE